MPCCARVQSASAFPFELSFRNLLYAISFSVVTNETLQTSMTADDAGAARFVAWFCLRSHPKHEHLAATHLQKIDGVEVFNPRLKYERRMRNRSVSVIESMFPNYLFARFDWELHLTRIHYSPGVAGVVHFGNKWPTVPEAAIEEIRRLVGNEGVRPVSNGFMPGDDVAVWGGVFNGLNATVMSVMPGKDRVLVLMDFLGRQSTVEIESRSIVKRVPGR